MAIDLGYLSRLLATAEGEGKPQDVLGRGGEYLTHEEAQKQIADMIENGVEVLPIGDCDHMDERGYCLGHRRGA
jgi:hypothetical protein